MATKGQHEELDLLSCEIQLYLEDKHGRTDPATVAAALCAAAAGTLVRTLDPRSERARADVVDMLATCLRSYVEHAVDHPEPYSPREILDLYKNRHNPRPVN